MNIIIDGSWNSNADLNQDNFINVQDIITLVNIILGTYYPDGFEFHLGDFNNDQDINVLDIICIVNVILE